MSPGCARTLLGENVMVPLGPPTWTICVLTIPEGVVDCDSDPLPVDTLPLADAVADASSFDSDAAMDDCAAAKPMRADTTSDLEKNILIAVLLFGWIGYCSITSVEDVRVNGFRRLAL